MTRFMIYAVMCFAVQIVLSLILPNPFSWVSVFGSWVISLLLYGLGFGIYVLYRKFWQKTP